jgi:hypothetical protein
MTENEREYYGFWKLLFESLQEIIIMTKQDEGESEVEQDIEKMLKKIYRKTGE